MASTNPHEIVTGVKQAVTEEVASLTPDAKIVATEYFNHSYMPDLVVEWREAGKSDSRPIFIRNTLRPSTAAEVQALAAREPMMVSLDSRIEPPSALRRQAQEARRVLVTDLASLAEVAAPASSEGSTNLGGPGEPLVRLIQTNLVKGGRGLLTADDAGRLIRSATPETEDSNFNADFLHSFQESTEEVFTEDAALRLQRAAELLHLGISPEDVRHSETAFGGELSDVELRVLLPYLLNNLNAVTKPDLWIRIGSMMSLERLEDMTDILEDVDVSPLVVANAQIWRARRAQLVIDNESEALDGDQEEHPAAQDETDSETSTWRVRNRMLIANVGRWRVLVTTDARRLRGRDGSLAARWDDIAELLSGFALDAVDLRGVSRRILVSAEQSGDVRGDVRLIRDSIEDSFHVTEVHVRRIGDDTADSVMRTDFADMTVSATNGAPISSIVSALHLLAHRWPADFTSLIDRSAPA
ncbi:hypothetical protein [Actinokineospora cianjurensis]|nr:hypothetical protein [Actinokineospora cianjurensis]